MIRKTLSNELVKGSLTLFVMFNVFNILNFVFQFSMARMLGPENYGIFAVLTTLIYFIAIPSDTVQTIVAKYTSRFKARGEVGKINYLTRRIMYKGLTIASLIFLISIPLLLLFAYFLEIPYYLSLLTGFMIFTIFLSPVTRGVMQGMQYFNSLGINMIADTSLRIIAAVTLVYIGFEAYGAIIAILFGSFAAFFISLIPIRKIMKERKYPTSIQSWKENFSPIAIILLAILAMQSIDVILAKRFFSAEIAGHYAVANLIGKMIFFGTLAISKAMFPLSSERFEGGVNTKNLFSKSLFIVGILCLASLIVIGIFPKLLINILFGNEYIEISSILIYIGLAFSFISLANVVLLYAVSIDKKISIYPVVLALVIQVILLSLFNNTLNSFAYGMLFSSIFLFVVSLLTILTKK